MKKKFHIKLIIQTTVVAIYLIGCSSANTITTPEATPTDILTLIPTATNTPLSPTKISTHTPIPPSSTKEGKPDEYYQQLSKDLETFHLLVQSMESPTGLKINNFEAGGYSAEKLQEGIEKLIELACNKPELIPESVKSQPFLLSAPQGNDGRPLDNLKINVQGCEFTRETLLKLEEVGLTMILSQQVSDQVDVFPGISEFTEFDSLGNPTGIKALGMYRSAGMVLGNRDFLSMGSGVIGIFKEELGHQGASIDFDYSRAVFKKGVTTFKIPSDSEGNMVFSTFISVSNDTTPEEIVELILKGTLFHQKFNHQFEFTSESFSE